MKCIKCFQEIPEGSKFCPHCGAQQPDAAGADQVNTQAQADAPADSAAQQSAAQPESTVQPENAAQQGDAVAQQTDAAASQAESQTYSEPQPQYQDAQSQYSGAGYQDSYNAGYQNNQSYQTPPTYQSSYEPEKQVNWVPYLVLSIISTVCCCIPFGIVAIVYSAKINSATAAGDYETAAKAAKTARIWIIVSFVVGILANIIVAVAYGGLIGAGSYYYY